ncbi:hypothetical protein DL96DRAFT_1583324 [Flagelloscypha sp. PMI_526]|nr:hypothetical protein DL96DRAFT_1583324 [Flagelloscypha sp. PMI_526]
MILRPTARSSLPFARSRCYASFATRPQHDVDVLIVGGGPAGLALASTLGSSETLRSNLKTVLVEAGDLSKVRNWTCDASSFSNRVSSLTNASQLFLQEIGAWKHLDNSRTCAVQDMKVWDGISDSRIEFSSSELNLPNPEAGMSRLTENLNLQRGLLNHLESLPSSVTLKDRSKVTKIVPEESPSAWPLVHLDNGDVYRTRLLVGADGFNSPVRSYAGISSFGWSYDTQAIVSTMTHHPSYYAHTTAFQRFLPTGPIAFLPLSPTTSSLVWSTQPPLAKALQAAEPSVLVTMINAAFRLPDVSMQYLHKLILQLHKKGTPITLLQLQEELAWRERSHNISSHSPYSSLPPEGSNEGVPPIDSDMLPPLITSIQPDTIASFPLRFNHADAYLGSLVDGGNGRTVLVGDAAHTIHPLAGQGLNLGLGDVECLGRCIENTIEQGGDIGSHTALLPYSTERYFENHKMMSAVDKLHKLYSTRSEPVVWARSVGLEIVNELDSVKAAIMMTAGGDANKTSSRSGGGGAVWDFAGSSVQAVVAGLNVAERLGKAAAGSLLQRFSK